MSDTVAAGKLRAFIERVERIEEEIAALNSDKSEIYKEIRGEGYDVKTVRKIVAKRKLDSFEREEQDALFDLYWNALHNGSSRVHVHEDDEQAAAKSAVDLPSLGQPVNLTQEPADYAEQSGDESSATNSPSAALTPEQLSAPEVAPPSALGATITTRSAAQAADGGKPSEPSSDDDGAKMGEAEPLHPERAASAGHVNVKSEQAATIPEHVPSFLIQKKTAADYRPNCLKPDACGASGLQHCYSCRKAMAESEAA